MADVQGNANLRVPLEATDAGTMSGAWVEHDHRRLAGIDAIVPALVADLGDPEQGVVHRPAELAGVEQRLVLEVQQWRQTRLLVLEHGVGPPPQRIEKQDRPLQNVALIGQHVEGRRGRRVVAFAGTRVGRGSGFVGQPRCCWHNQSLGLAA